MRQRVAQYVELARRWSAGHKNRLIKVPATPAGLEALEPLAAAGVKLNVTLIFTSRQYRAACDAIWRGTARERIATTSRASTASSSRGWTSTRSKQAATLAGGPRHGRHPQRQANLGGEPGLLARAAHPLGPGDRLCQHGHEEAGQSPGNTSKPLPAATSRPTPRRRTKRSSEAAARFRARWTSFPRRTSSPKSIA